MNWSDAERQLAEEERKRKADAEREAAWQAERLREEQISSYRVQQFLATMKKAGNPGIRYENPLDWLRRKGYWEYHGSDFMRAWVCTDGTYVCKCPDDSPGGARGGPYHVVKMLTGILRSYNVLMPED